jgi:hypothetical protein
MRRRARRVAVAAPIRRRIDPPNPMYRPPVDRPATPEGGAYDLGAATRRKVPRVARGPEAHRPTRSATSSVSAPTSRWRDPASVAGVPWKTARTLGMV